MEVFGKKIRENWFDVEYVHAGYNFVEVHREEEFVIFQADGGQHFELYQRRQSEKLRNYLPNKSNWGAYAWTIGSLERCLEKIKLIKEENEEIIEEILE